jgi:[acyl-carrier-protein] S-malonyltransferase
LPVTEIDDARRLLLEQLTSPVRWTSVIGGIAKTFPNAVFVEMGPGNVLTNLTKRIAPSVKSAAAGTAADVEQLLRMVS